MYHIIYIFYLRHTRPTLPEQSSHGTITVTSDAGKGGYERCAPPVQPSLPRTEGGREGARGTGGRGPEPEGGPDPVTAFLHLITAIHPHRCVHTSAPPLLQPSLPRTEDGGGLHGPYKPTLHTGLFFRTVTSSPDSRSRVDLKGPGPSTLPLHTGLQIRYKYNLFPVFPECYGEPVEYVHPP